jgi:hypothetical protein
MSRFPKSRLPESRLPESRLSKSRRANFYRIGTGSIRNEGRSWQ